jgi:hypothetical protein
MQENPIGFGKWKFVVLTLFSMFLSPAHADRFSFSFGTYPQSTQDLQAFAPPANTLGLDWHRLDLIGALSVTDRQRLKAFRKLVYQRYLANGMKKDNWNRICWAIPGLGQPRSADRDDYAQFVSAKIPLADGPKPFVTSVVQLTTAECLTEDGENFGRNFSCSPHSDGTPKNATECANDEPPNSKVSGAKEFKSDYYPVSLKDNLVVGTYRSEGSGKKGTSESNLER